MKNLQKAGGFAALIEAVAFLIAIVLMVTVISPAGYGSPDLDPVNNAAFLVNNQAVMYFWNLIGYIVFGAFLVVHALALYERLKDGPTALAQIATAFALIWAALMFASGMVANIGAGVVREVYTQNPAQAGSVWLSLHFVVDGLGGGNEIVGGLWVFLISLAALTSGKLPKALNYFGLLVSTAGLVTIIPALKEAGAIFGLGSILWFVWVGVVMLRKWGKETLKTENKIRSSAYQA